MLIKDQDCEDQQHDVGRRDAVAEAGDMRAPWSVLGGSSLWRPLVAANFQDLQGKVARLIVFQKYTANWGASDPYQKPFLNRKKL